VPSEFAASGVIVVGVRTETATELNERVLRVHDVHACVVPDTTVTRCTDATKRLLWVDGLQTDMCGRDKTQTCLDTRWMPKPHDQLHTARPGTNVFVCRKETAAQFATVINPYDDDQYPGCDAFGFLAQMIRTELGVADLYLLEVHTVHEPYALPHLRASSVETVHESVDSVHFRLVDRVVTFETLAKEHADPFVRQQPQSLTVSTSADHKSATSSSSWIWFAVLLALTMTVLSAYACYAFSRKPSKRFPAPQESLNPRPRAGFVP